MKIILNAPYNQILACLALPFGPIMSKSYVETVGDEQFAREPMGTGPYKFVNWVRGEKVVLEANEDYFLGAPAIKHVEWVTIADTSAALLNLESSDIDAYCDIQTSDYLKGSRTVGIVIHGDCIAHGHGPGITTVLVTKKPIIHGVLDSKANIADFIFSRSY